MQNNSTSLADLRIVFMGTPEFAVASLQALLQAGCNVVGVVTAPDKPAGRGMKMTQSAVKQYAQQQNLLVLQPPKLKDPEFVHQLKNLNPTLQIVVAFRMLPEVVWNLPPLGTINLHGSLLPQYRGAAPINWAVINGETETGVTTFKLQHAIDTGNILLQQKFSIGENDTAGEVHDIMKEIGANLLVTTVQGLADGSLQETPQSVGENQFQLLKHAPKLFTDDCKINWQNNCTSVHNLIRGLSPYPGALCMLNGKLLKIYRSSKQEMDTNVQPGTYLTDKKTYLKFACSNGFIQVLDLQLEGKKRMTITEFLRGYRFSAV